MRRFLMCCGLLIPALLSTGCCQMACLNPCSGCGKAYWGAYAEDPPRCEPCNDCGDYVGGCGSCGNSDRTPWGRTRARRMGFISALLGDDCDSCCESTCTSGCTTGCTESSCGEPACGEPACGHGGFSSVGSGSRTMLSSYDAQTSTWRAPRVQQATARRTIVEARPTQTASAPCNCGRH